MGNEQSGANKREQRIQFSDKTRLIERFPLDSWPQKRPVYGFEERSFICNGVVNRECNSTFCLTSQQVIDLQSQNLFDQLCRKSKFSKMVDQVEYRHIPAHISSIQNFHVKGIICHHGRCMLLHLYRNRTSQFGLVDLASNCFIGPFGHQPVEYPNDEVLARLSHDRTRCLIRVPSYPAVADEPETLLLFKIDANTRSIVELGRWKVPFEQTSFAFDPRFQHSQLALTNCQGTPNSVTLARMNDSLQLTILAVNSNLESFSFCDLRYTPDGTLVIVTLARQVACNCREKRRLGPSPSDCCIAVLNSDNADTLHVFHSKVSACTLHRCPQNYLPVVSLCSRKVAIRCKPRPSSKDSATECPDFVEVFNLPMRMTSLQASCRTVILQCVRSKQDLENMSLPRRVIQFLQCAPQMV